MKTLVIAPHPDDELLGCGGTLLRRSEEGADVGWLITTTISEDAGWDRKRVELREKEIQQVRDGLGVKPEHLFRFSYPTASLDTVPLDDLIKKISEVFVSFEPEEVFLPHRGDAHSDHRYVFDAAAACTKWFRYPSVRKVLTYETLSETEFGLGDGSSFQPNLFMDVSGYLDKKIELLACYASEMGEHPFPRSEESVRALATLRGSSAGFPCAEAFELLLSREPSR
jgi:LmbE family N-acetylglucosaminyl deacetylase